MSSECTPGCSCVQYFRTYPNAIHAKSAVAEGFARCNTAPPIQFADDDRAVDCPACIAIAIGAFSTSEK